MSSDGVNEVLVNAFAKEAKAETMGNNPTDGLAYFSRFGVDEGLFRAAFAKALSRGGDWAELYFEHRVAHHVGLEDGAVNRAHSSISLGVGIRVLKGDQTGYAYTEDLSQKSVLDAASNTRVTLLHNYLCSSVAIRHRLAGMWREQKPKKLPREMSWCEWAKYKTGHHLYRFCPSDFCRALFQIERSTFHSYGLDAHSCGVLCTASTGWT